jgi:hypothetical protein
MAVETGIIADTTLATHWVEGAPPIIQTGRLLYCLVCRCPMWKHAEAMRPIPCQKNVPMCNSAKSIFHSHVISSRNDTNIIMGTNIWAPLRIHTQSACKECTHSKKYTLPLGLFLPILMKEDNRQVNECVDEEGHCFVILLQVCPSYWGMGRT